MACDIDRPLAESWELTADPTHSTLPGSAQRSGPHAWRTSANAIFHAPANGPPTTNAVQRWQEPGGAAPDGRPTEEVIMTARIGPWSSRSSIFGPRTRTCQVMARRSRTCSVCCRSLPRRGRLARVTLITGPGTVTLLETHVPCVPRYQRVFVASVLEFTQRLGAAVRGPRTGRSRRWEITSRTMAR